MSRKMLISVFVIYEASVYCKDWCTVLVAVCLSCFSGCTNTDETEFTCRAMQAEGGYGYMVLHKGDTLIRQPYIPAVGRKIAFATKEDALKVAKLVCRKLDEKQSPSISKEEITMLGIIVNRE